MSADPITLGGLRGKLALPELRELPKLLQPGEDVVSLVQGWLRGKAGVLVATTDRLLFLDKGWLFGLHYEQFAYPQLTAVQYDGGLVEVTPTAIGSDPQKLTNAFAVAAEAAPCILFVDELEQIARRSDPRGPVVEQLIALLEQARAVHGLVVVAATSDLDALDEDVVRPGRFDRKLQVGLPDASARRAILTVALTGRPTDPQLDLDGIAARSDGLTAAALLQAVDAAALAGMEASAPVSTAHLVQALQGLGGVERPTVDGWTWERLILPEKVESELKALQATIEDPERARKFGVEPPTGALLVGPPGTGKTTVARVLAAQAQCSFFPVSAADVTSKWAGESEQSVKRLFERARAAAPAIVFLDEADALGAARGENDGAGYDRQLNQLLQEMDGLGGDRGVFVLAPTSRPDRLDPALTRGGRLSRTIELPLPDEQGRRAMLGGMTQQMPLTGVDLDALATRAEGFSGADLQALCQQAAVAAIARGAATGQPQVLAADFDAALADLPAKQGAPA